LRDSYQKWDPRDTKTAIGCGSHKGYGKKIHETFAAIGRRVAFAEAKLTDAHGKLYASATSTLLVFDR
jgi:acyl-coenzyme A thioesterase PaaI-like protein